MTSGSAAGWKATASAASGWSVALAFVRARTVRLSLDPLLDVVSLVDQKEPENLDRGLWSEREQDRADVW